MGKNPMRLPVLVIGAGAWGTAIAVHFARRTDQGWVILAGRDADQMLAVNAHRENKKYLPGVILPATLQVTSDLSAACVDWRAQAQDLHLVVEGRQETLKSVQARIRSLSHLTDHQARARGSGRRTARGDVAQTRALCAQREAAS